MTNGSRLRVHHLPDLTSMRREMERTMRQVFGDAADTTTSTNFVPALDVEEDDDRFVVHVELPGVDPEQVEVSLEDGVLTVVGERRFYDDKETDGFRRIERRFGSFRRAIHVPDRVEADRVEAVYRDGLLTVTVPKAEDAKPRRITVTAA